MYAYFNLNYMYNTQIRRGVFIEIYFEFVALN